MSKKSSPSYQKWQSEGYPLDKFAGVYMYCPKYYGRGSGNGAGEKMKNEAVRNKLKKRKKGKGKRRKEKGGE